MRARDARGALRAPGTQQHRLTTSARRGSCDGWRHRTNLKFCLGNLSRALTFGPLPSGWTFCSLEGAADQTTEEDALTWSKIIWLRKRRVGVVTRSDTISLVLSQIVSQSLSGFVHT